MALVIGTIAYLVFVYSLVRWANKDDLEDEDKDFDSPIDYGFHRNDDGGRKDDMRLQGIVSEVPKYKATTKRTTTGANPVPTETKHLVKRIEPTYGVDMMPWVKDHMVQKQVKKPEEKKSFARILSDLLFK